MARRSYECTPLLPGMDPAPQASPKPRSNPAAAKARGIPWLRISLRVTVLGVALVGAMWGFQKVEQFLIRDPRFALSGPTGESPTLEVRGAVHASRESLERVFSQDFGRSVYLAPLAERRQSLQHVDWVKDASIARLWPNRIVADIMERRPVAFVALSATRFALIDEDGVILPPATDRYPLPVLTGIRNDDTPALRRDRVRRMLQLIREVGELANRISEIDVADRDNLKIRQAAGDGMVTLVLGDRNFAARMRNYYSHHADINKRLPGARTLDLRLEDRITVVE